MSKEQIKPDLPAEAKAAVTDLHAAGYDCEFERREEHGIVTFKVEAVGRGQDRGANVRIVGKKEALGAALLDLSKRLLPHG